MKYIGFLIAIALVYLSSCNKSDNNEFDEYKCSCSKLDTVTFSHSEKGWELYSWPENDYWKYSLLAGTNANKTTNQVIQNNISVIGVDSLKAVLCRLPSGEEILWIGNVWIESCWNETRSIFQLPDRKTQVEIKEFCNSKGLALTIID